MKNTSASFHPEATAKPPTLPRTLLLAAQRLTWEHALLGALLAIVLFMAFYNLERNPRPWHDEGSYLSVSRTLAEDGVYAVRSSDGYQTFGPVQSLGPTLLVPVAMVYKVFGVGIIQARMVAVVLLLLTLLAFYFTATTLFGRRAAIAAGFILVASPAARFFLYGRQVLGEVPALGFILAGWLAWAAAARANKPWLAFLSGLMIGLALVTKSQYQVVVAGTLGIIALLDLFYYRQRNGFWFTLIAGCVAVACAVAWYGWQYLYFGRETFLENLGKLAQLSQYTTGFHPSVALHGLRSLFGSDMGNFYLFWGPVTLVYFAPYCLRKDPHARSTAFLYIFIILWTAMYTFLLIPWHRYALPAMTLLAIFIAKIFVDLAEALAAALREQIRQMRQPGRRAAVLSSQGLLTLGTLIALFTFSLWLGYHFEKILRADVLGGDETMTYEIYTPRQIWAPPQVAEYINTTMDRQVVTETWERELAILTDLNFHYPDQVLLAAVDAALFHNGPRDYQLGEAYFNEVKPYYVIVGYYARTNQAYDMEYIHSHYSLIKVVGSSGWQYEIFQRNS